MADLYRTFVRLDDHEKTILQNLQKILRKPNGKLPTQTAVIKGMIRDYWDILKAEREKENQR